MSAGQVSAGFLFLGATPTDCGNDRDAEEAAPQEVPVLFFAQMPKGFEDIFGNSESIGKSVRREILAQDKA